MTTALAEALAELREIARLRAEDELSVDVDLGDDDEERRRYWHNELAAHEAWRRRHSRPIFIER